MKSFSKKIITILILSISIISFSQNIYAQDGGSSEMNSELPRTFALGFSLLKEHGSGGMFKLRSNHFALDGGIGYGMLAIVYEDSYDMSFKFPLQVDGGLIIYFSDQYRLFQNGIRVSGLWNEGYGLGGMIGWVGDLVWDSFSIGFGAGLQYYPDALEGVKKRYNIEMDRSLSGLPVGLEIYIGVNLMWYIF